MIALAASEMLRLRSRRVLQVLTALAIAGILVGMTVAAAKSSAPFHALELSSLPDMLKGLSFILFIFGLVIGASSVGAEWQAGTMATLLTWEPRRDRVFWIRLVVVTVTVAAIAVALQLLLAGLWVAVANLRGTTLHSEGVLGASAGVIARVGALAAFGAAIAIAISMIGRSSAAALGAVFVYLTVVENLLRALSPGITKWTLAVNVVVFVDGKGTVVQLQERAIAITFAGAMVVIAVYLAAILAVGWFWFRSRDVG